MWLLASASLTTTTPPGRSKRRAWSLARIRSNQVRLITGTPLDVLPKLRDGAYDIVLINGDRLEYVEYVSQALRLLGSSLTLGGGVDAGQDTMIGHALQEGQP
jgi:hypothetical protein